MNYKLIKVRDKIIKEVWEEYKSEYDADKLAEIFNLPVSSFYRIIKKLTKVEVK